MLPKSICAVTQSKFPERIMIYTKTARIISGITLILGILSVFFGFLVAIGVSDQEAARIIGNSGKVIDRGLYLIFSAVVLGVLTEISWSVANNK
jgi:hypothetical protein